MTSISKEDLEDAAFGLTIIRADVKRSLDTAMEKLARNQAPSYDKYLELFISVKVRRELLEDLDAKIKQGSDALL